MCSEIQPGIPVPAQVLQVVVVRAATACMRDGSDSSAVALLEKSVEAPFGIALLKDDPNMMEAAQGAAAAALVKERMDNPTSPDDDGLLDLVKNLGKTVALFAL